MSMVSIPVPADLEHVLKPVLRGDPEKGAEWLRAGFLGAPHRTVISSGRPSASRPGSVCGITGREPMGTGRLITGTGFKGDQSSRIAARFSAPVF